MRLQVAALPQEPRGDGWVVPYLLILDEVGDDAATLNRELADMAERAGARAVLVFARRCQVVPPWGPEDVVLAEDLEPDDVAPLADALGAAAAREEHR